MPSIRRSARRHLLLVPASAAALSLVLAACSSTGSSQPAAASSPAGSASAASAASTAPLTVGFIMVGSRHDYGYNQAVYVASQKVGAALPGVKVLTADNIPENSSVTQTMQAMANAGAKVIFATSYGYYSYALAFARSHPGIVVLHQGGFDSGTFPPNFGTYWGEAFEPVSLGGMAAGSVTRTGKLGFVYAFPISQTIANIDAFELGAQSVDPAAKTYIVNTSNWCDPLKQKEAAAALLAQGVDVLTQHQDCQATVIEAARAAGKYVVGYHYDAHNLYPSGWLTGSAWNWAPVYEAIISTVRSGTFTGSKYNANWVGTFASKDNPLQLASFGPAVTPAVRARIEAEYAALEQPGASVFKGPVYCQDGSTLYAAGVVPTYAQINSISCLVKGVVGTLPRS